jgi:Rieske Fe-S protein
MRETTDERATANSRRRFMHGALCATVCAATAVSAKGAGTPADKLPPSPGDELAFPSWEQDGRLVRPDDLAPGAAPLLVYPRDAVSGTLRERSRLNQILLLQAEAGALPLAFSAVCTHAACAVSEWNGERRVLVCPCHASEYDPAQRAKVVAGPAPRALPALPIALRDDRYVVTGAFTGPVGASA